MGLYMGCDFSLPCVLFFSYPTDYLSIIWFALMISVPIVKSTHPAWTTPSNIRVPFTLTFGVLMAHNISYAIRLKSPYFPSV